MIHRPRPADPRDLADLEFEANVIKVARHGAPLLVSMLRRIGHETLHMTTVEKIAAEFADACGGPPTWDQREDMNRIRVIDRTEIKND